ncbi:hypothetical protein F5Y17DRAFT_429769 [Xylariaceae sp. FL0594]|nr:hypothetical protein F5Y17DRAFT_429769 [Xylariaceae sp. FL0594]
MAVSILSARSARGGRGRGGRSFNPRPFYATVLLLAFLLTYSTFREGLPLAQKPHQASLLITRHDPHLVSGEDCRLVHNAADKCAFVKRNCDDEQAGLVPYLTLYYCGLGSAQPLGFIILVLWLGLLFTTIGIAASDFFSINLSTIATFLRLSQSLAGVTFLALGNGSPDVFSTFAAMSSNSGSMAVGELIGAAGFITSVVAGSMALVCEFRVDKNTFVRDICFFIVAVSFTIGFLFDGRLYLWECILMIAFYIFYVIFVVSWHAYTKRRKARRAKEAAARGHFYRTSSQQGDEELEPYRDEPEDEDRPVSAGPVPINADVDLLERAPLIEIGAPEEDRDDESDRNQHIAAEVASSMRVNRPRGRRRTATITPIRPSLVGALEFRSVLASLQREGNVQMRPILARAHSAHSAHSTRSGPRLSIHGPAKSSDLDDAASGEPGTTRARAHSSGAVPNSVDHDIIARQPADETAQYHAPHTIGGRLAPPVDDRLPDTTSPDHEDLTQGVPRPVLHQLRIPSPAGSDRSSLEQFPFPRYTDSPMVMTPNTTTQQQPILDLTSPVQELGTPFLGLPAHMEPKPVKWWPYKFLPPPHVLRNTLFPTLRGWHTKSIWDKFVSVISVPTIFLLVITLPVVENETIEEESEDGDIDDGSLFHPHLATPTSINPHGGLGDETEWQRYRRSTRPGTPSRSPSPNPMSIHNTTLPATSNVARDVSLQPSVEIHSPSPSAHLGLDTSTVLSEDLGWNRWLYMLQIFTGPLLCVFVVWANINEGLENPGKDLVRASLASLVFSLVLLGILLSTTSPYHRPKYHVAFCFLGFVISIAWISTVAGEVVGVMKAFGVILGISEAILGLTIFAIGNSIGDLVADITVARLGYQVMALSACFGGPLLNILLGIGLGGAYQAMNSAERHHAKHPERPHHTKPYHIQVTGTLVVSAIALLMTLFTLLVVVPINKWMMTRKIGWGLIAFWLTATTVNLVIELTGVWQDVS